MSFGLARQGNRIQAYHLRGGRSHHYSHAPIYYDTNNNTEHLQLFMGTLPAITYGWVLPMGTYYLCAAITYGYPLHTRHQLSGRPF